MGSRRTATRSASWNGTSSSGDHTSGSSRPGGCSYISNVRPENRSTLCSVMAQLTEETQPSFEITLKSKSVSENCNVKFSCAVTGHPTPQVTWYKDDMQLDRYCGLPKYEIFHNGPNHSLHIYNCTVEDAAIYQASAINCKGIVSCSGVLEVGEMNEFKIHQRFFAKLKQKAENRHREAEGKENQEPLRTISPDRTLRKRRSTMEAFLSTPSSLEDECNEERHQAVAVQTEARLQEATEEKAAEEPIANGQVVNEKGNKGGAHVCDTAPKMSAAHQTKTPFVKKKIKIWDNGTKVAKAETLGERTPEERRGKDRPSSSVAPTCRDPEKLGNSEEVMEVEKISNFVPQQRQKSPRGGPAALLVKRPVKDERVRAVPPKPEQPAVSASPGGTDRDRAAKREDEAGHKGTVGNSQKHTRISDLDVTSTQSQSVLLSIVKEGFTKTDTAAAMDVDEKTDNATGRPLRRVDLRAGGTPCEGSAASPPFPCERAGDGLSEKEPSPCPESVSDSQLAPLSEVPQVQTKMTRNDAPVKLKLPPSEHVRGAVPLQKTPSESRPPRDAMLTPSLHRGPPAVIDKMTQDIQDHSRESSESKAVFFTGRHKPPLQNLGAGENNQDIVPLTPQSQVDANAKTTEEAEAHVDNEVEAHKDSKLLMEADNVTPNHGAVEMETEAVAVDTFEKTRDAVDKDADAVGVEASCKGQEEPVSKPAQQIHSDSQNVMANTTEAAVPHTTNNPENTNTVEQIIGFREIPKPATRVISVAELLRLQIKALDLALDNSVLTIPMHADFIQEPTTTPPATCQGLRNNDRKSKEEVKMSTPDKKTETITDDTPATTIRETLMDLYNQMNKTNQEQTVTRSEVLPPAQASEKPVVVEPTGPNGCTKEDDKGAVDVGQEPGTGSGLVPLMDRPVDSLTESPNIKLHFPPPASKDELTSVSNLSGGVSQSGTVVMKQVQDEPVQSKDMASIQKLTPEIKLTGKMEECDKNTVCELSTGKQDNNLQLFKPDKSMVEEFSRNDSLPSPNPESSPLLKKRNCVSPIPSATPQELASGARRKILIPKAQPEEVTEVTSPVDNQDQKKEVSAQSSKLSTSPITPAVSPGVYRRSPLLQPAGERTPPEGRSPLLSRRKTAVETQAPIQQPTEKVHSPDNEGKPTEKDKNDPFKAPQVIRKIRGETFADASGHMKLWCQFFNVLSDSTIKWFKNGEAVAQVKKIAGDETQVNLAIVQASCRDFGVYKCSITNTYGTDATETLLSTDIIAGMSLREDLGVGEEIEMTPLIFSKGVAESGIWGNKLFGRIMMHKSRIGDGCSHKVWRAKVIYGLEPVFESGDTCIIKMRNPIAYGGKEEIGLLERNLDFVKQDCKMQNLAREYCKIFSAEARVIENFGPCLEVVPVYLMYRPANSVPYATVEADLPGLYQKYSGLDHAGRLEVRTGSVVEQKCCALQHWIFQWTSGNLLLTRLEGVDTRITNVGISVKSAGHQSLSIEGNPKVFEHFVSQHQCNYFCGLLGLRSLKVMDSLLTPTKPKASRSPLLQRKMAAGSSSPQTGRKAAGSPRLPRKDEQEGRKTPTTPKAADVPKDVK